MRRHREVDHRRAGGRAIAVGADVSDADSVAAAVDTVVTELGAPTVLINNAGIIRDNMLFQMSVDDWDAVMAVHLRGAFNINQACQKHMVDAGWGRIVNLSSTSALGNQQPGQLLGRQGRHAGLHQDPGHRSSTKFGITANAIAPRLHRHRDDRRHRRHAWAWSSRTSRGQRRRHPVARVGEPGTSPTPPRSSPARRRLRLRPGHLRRRRPRG